MAGAGSGPFFQPWKSHGELDETCHGRPGWMGCSCQRGGAGTPPAHRVKFMHHGWLESLLTVANDAGVVVVAVAGGLIRVTGTSVAAARPSARWRDAPCFCVCCDCNKTGRLKIGLDTRRGVRQGFIMGWAVMRRELLVSVSRRDRRRSPPPLPPGTPPTSFPDPKTCGGVARK